MPAFFPVAFPSVAASIAGRILVVVGAVAIQTTIGAGQTTDAPAPSANKLERITEFFNNEIATGNLPGAVVLIQQHGKPVYLKCFGVQAVETNAPMTSDTIFALHSMTKPITSVAAMMLIDAGKLSLADPVSKFIPGFADIKVGVGSVDSGRNVRSEACPAGSAGDHYGLAAPHVRHHLRLYRRQADR